VPNVTRAIRGLGEEGMRGGVLTGLMVVLSRDWRSARVVCVIQHPVAVRAAMLGAGDSGQTSTHDMVIGVGWLLVDAATVSIENIHTHCAEGPVPETRRVRRDRGRPPLPRIWLAMLSSGGLYTDILYARRTQPRAW